MKKRIAVIVRDRQSEALRMGIGLTILDDEIDIFVLDRKLEQSEAVRSNLEMMRELGMKVYTNTRENEGLELVSLDEVAERLLHYDHVLPY